MSSKRAAYNNRNVKKRPRRTISLEVKLDILKRWEAGERQIDICKALSLAESTVRSILKNAEKIKEQKSLNLGLKLNVLNRSGRSERQCEISKAYTLAGSTVRTILKNAKKIKEGGKSATPLSTVRLTRSRATILVEMEKQLSDWIRHHNECGVPLNLLIIQEKARSLYDDLKQYFPESSSTEKFTASRGWFTRFKRRANLHNIVLGGDVPSEDEDGFIHYGNEVASVNGITPYQEFIVDESEPFWPSSNDFSRDENSMPSLEVTAEISTLSDQAPVSYNNELLEIIHEGGYTPQQVFNVDETGLYWKRIPTVSTSCKDRVTLLLGGNAAGDFKLKPMVVYHTENPKALQGFSKNCLPVIWRSNKKAWVTKQVFESWFTAYFCPTVKEYCSQNSLENKALLVLDNASGHPTMLEDLCQNVKVIFLPENHSLVQPMDQGVIATLKINYLNRVFSQAHKVTDGGNSPNFKSFWKNYCIRQAIQNISCAWEDVSHKTMHWAWRKLWPECIHNFQGLEEPVTVVQNTIIKLGKKLGFEELEIQDIQEWMESHKQELSNEELERLKKLEDYNSDDDVELSRTLTIQNLGEFFRYLNSAITVISENDPDMQRSNTIAQAFNNLSSCYWDLYNEKKKKDTRKALVIESSFVKHEIPELHSSYPQFSGYHTNHVL